MEETNKNITESNLMNNQSAQIETISNNINFKALVSKAKSTQQHKLSKINLYFKKKNSLVKRLHNLYTSSQSRKFIKTTKREIFFEEQFYNKLCVSEFLNFFFAFFSMAFSITYSELSFTYKNNDQFDLYLILVSIFSFLLWINLYFCEFMYLEYDKMRNIVGLEETLYSTKRIYFLIGKLVVFLVHPNYFFKGETYNVTYPQIIGQPSDNSRLDNQLLTAFVLLRIYFLLRFLIFISKNMEPTADTIYKSFYFEANFIYAIKVILTEHAIPVFFGSITFMSIYFAYMVRIFEMTVQDSLVNFYNMIWYMLITMTTVGYGDITSKTDEGRFICIVAIIAGILIYTILIVSITNILKLRRDESLAFNILEIIKRNQMRDRASNKVLGNLFEIVLKNISLKETVYEQKEHFASLKKAMLELNEIEKEIKRTSQGDTKYYTLNCLFMCINKEFEDLEKKQKTFNGELDEIQERLLEIDKMLESEQNSRRIQDLDKTVLEEF